MQLRLKRVTIRSAHCIICSYQPFFKHASHCPTKTCSQTAISFFDIFCACGTRHSTCWRIWFKRDIYRWFLPEPRCRLAKSSLMHLPPSPSTCGIVRLMTGSTCQVTASDLTALVIWIVWIFSLSAESLQRLSQMRDSVQFLSTSKAIHVTTWRRKLGSWAYWTSD